MGVIWPAAVNRSCAARAPDRAGSMRRLNFVDFNFGGEGGISNPRYPCEHAAFRVRCFQPLSHLSAGPNRAYCPRTGRYLAKPGVRNKGCPLPHGNQAENQCPDPASPLPIRSLNTSIVNRKSRNGPPCASRSTRSAHEAMSSRIWRLRSDSPGVAMTCRSQRPRNSRP